MRLLLIIITIIYSSITIAQDYEYDNSCCLSRFQTDSLQYVKLSELSEDYKRLSAQGILCCDKWEGDLHKIMMFFASEFGQKGIPISKILEYMGMPDGTDKELYDAGIEIEDGEQALLYCWRSYHDFLYFVYENDEVKYSKWFHWDD